jgi:hypothetical protein
MQRSAAYDVLVRVQDELEAARFAVSAVLRDWHVHTSAARARAAGALTTEHLRRCRDHLEITYVLRLFAAWEAVLRDYWVHGLGRRTDPDLKPLIDSLATRRNVDDRTLATVHSFRVFRNALVHENLGELRYDYAQVTRGLAVFISYLPPSW